MSLADRTLHAVRRAPVARWAAGFVALATFAAVLSLEKEAGRQHRRAIPARQLTPVRPAALAPPRRDAAFWKRVALRTYEQIGEDRLLALAAGVTFYALLALFPAITALVSSYALFAKASTIGAHLAAVSTMIPASAYSVVNEQVTRIAVRTDGQLSLTFMIGLALALWSANAGVKAVMDALNIAYGAKERRGFVRLNLVSLTFTAGAVAAMLLAIGAIVVLPVASSYLPLGRFANGFVLWMRWPVLIALLLVGLALLYRFGPDLDNARFRWISPGAIVAALAWIAGSAALSWYLGSFANYDATYGSLGAAIGLMMWLWMSAIVVLFGAELNSEIDAATGHSQDEGVSIGDEPGG
jgi:membrane protein